MYSLRYILSLLTFGLDEIRCSYFGMVESNLLKISSQGYIFCRDYKCFVNFWPQVCVFYLIQSILLKFKWIFVSYLPLVDSGINFKIFVKFFPSGQL